MKRNLRPSRTKYTPVNRTKFQVQHRGTANLEFKGNSALRTSFRQSLRFSYSTLFPNFSFCCSIYFLSLHGIKLNVWCVGNAWEWFHDANISFETLILMWKTFWCEYNLFFIFCLRTSCTVHRLSYAISSHGILGRSFHQNWTHRYNTSTYYNIKQVSPVSLNRALWAHYFHCAQ